MKRILKVQEEIGVLGKDSKNPFFKSQYLDLNKLLIHVNPLLHKNGLVLLQPIREGYVMSQILDIENNNILAESAIALPNIQDPQKLGSAITYFRRYTLKSLLSIPEGDDDANLASQSELIDITPQAATENAKRGVSLAQMKTLYKMTKDQEVKYTNLLNQQ
jgi:regulator of sirC expression with transglutaminase-like and TPR domain